MKNNICMNCLNGGHLRKHYRSFHKCKKCQRPHHTLLHVEPHHTTPPTSSTNPGPAGSSAQSQVISNTAVKLRSSSLLMTCRVLVTSANGSSEEARALLDNGSSASFITERLAQGLNLPRVHQNVHMSGITGSSPKSPIQSIASLQISPAHYNGRRIDLTAIVVPRVTCDLPVHPVPFDLSWNHITGISLADPAFRQPSHIDILLGVDVFVDILHHGRRTGPLGSPVTLKTEFGWVLSGSTAPSTLTKDQVNLHVMALHTATTMCGDDILRKLWEIEESPMNLPVLSMEEHTVVCHFKTNHRRTEEGRFEVPLLRRSDAKPIGESRSQAVRRFLALERSLNHKGCFQEVNTVIQEYFDLGHAQEVPNQDFDKDPSKVFYLPMHGVQELKHHHQGQIPFSMLQPNLPLLYL